MKRKGQLKKFKKETNERATKDKTKLESKLVDASGSAFECNGEEDGTEDEWSDSREDESDCDEVDGQAEQVAKLSFDFEALPPAQEDLDDIERLLAQIFLQADIDKNGMAKVLVEQSPMGCVFRPAEEKGEEEEEEGDAITYGVLSIVPLSGGTKKFQSDIAALVLQRAKKHSPDEIFKRFESVLGDGSAKENVGFLVNERLLNFPAQIAGPAFQSLAEDYKSLPESQRFAHLLMFMKIRICSEQCPSTSSSSLNRRKKVKLGKAARKRQAIEQTAESNIIFDNSEEQILFEHSFNFPFFQYPVESEIEKCSKFHSTRRGGRIFRPFRRVCLLSIDQFHQFASSVAHSFTE